MGFRNVARASVLLGAIAGASVAAATPGATPGTLEDRQIRGKVEDQGRRFVGAVNGADQDQRKRTAREVFAPATLENEGETRVLELFDRVHDEFGHLDFHHAESIVVGDGEARRYSLHVYAKSAKDGRWHDLQFRLEPAPPHRIVSIAFIAEVAEPIYLPNGDVTDRGTQDWLSGYVDKLVAEEGLAGGLLIAKGDSVLFQRTFGYADSARRRAIGPRTRYDMASGGKMFTALCVARLVERGRLRFDDTLANVVPLLRNQDFARRVTIAHLLSHTSGIGEYWTDAYEKHRSEIRSLKDFLPFVLAAGTNFAPGTRAEYSNSNFILAGLVLESVTGKSYDQVLSDEILDPLGMHDTGLFEFDERDTLQAVPLRRAGTGWAPAGHGVKGSSAGGCMTTTPDMLKFARGLAGGKIVSPQMLTTMTTTKTAGLPEATMSYGYGFILEETREGVTSYGHGGITSGVNFELRHFSPGDVTLVAFSNQDNGAYDDLRRNATRLITGER